MLINLLVYILSLAISLEVSSYKQLNLSPKDLVKLLLKLRDKLQTAIRDNCLLVYNSTKHSQGRSI